MFSFLKPAVTSSLIECHCYRREVVFLTSKLRYYSFDANKTTSEETDTTSTKDVVVPKYAIWRGHGKKKDLIKRNYSGEANNGTKYSSSKLLVTGASGQVGKELVPYLRTIYGGENVIASDILSTTSSHSTGPFFQADVLNSEHISQIVQDENIDTVIHLAAILSAKGEKNPQLTLTLNNGGTQNILNIARQYGLKVFCPSTIAVFGPQTPKDDTPDETIMCPTTVYGISKVYMELLGNYYHNIFGVDFRSLRYPGVISTKSPPGGGTTDYAVEIFPSAIKHRRYTCFLKEDTALPMMYMPDLLRATVDVIEADTTALKQRVYNVGAMSFTPRELGRSIRRYVKDFELDYRPDFRQAIADSWPRSVDYSPAERDWCWRPEYDLERMTDDIMSESFDEELMFRGRARGGVSMSRIIM